MKPRYLAPIWGVVLALALPAPKLAAQIANGTGEKPSLEGHPALNATAVLASGATLLRPMRAASAIVTVSMRGSVGTVIEIGPVQLGLVDSHAAGFAELVTFDPAGKLLPLGLNLPLAETDGVKLAVVPLLTVRIDRGEATFELYADAQLIAADIPIGLASDRQRIVIVAGEHGARVRSVTESDRNPLFEDTNDNGIDDDFERGRIGRLLAVENKEERKALAQEWRDHLKRAPSAVKAIHLDSLMPGGG